MVECLTGEGGFFCHNRTMLTLNSPLGRAFVVMVALSTAGQGGAVENLPDPTRPPSVLAPEGQSGGEATLKAPPPLPVLQSVMLSANRKAALISGQTVLLGGKFGDLRLVKMTHDEVVLKGEGGVQVLKFFPDVEKKVRVAPPPDEIVKVKKNKPGAAVPKKAKPEIAG